MTYNKKNVDNLLRKKQRLFEGFLYRKVMSLFQESVQRRREIERSCLFFRNLYKEDEKKVTRLNLR